MNSGEGNVNVAQECPHEEPVNRLLKYRGERYGRRGFAQKVENTTHGSGWIVQIFSTSHETRGVCANPTHGSGWMVQILSTSICQRKCSREKG
jgi:hypothetical protein